VEEHFKGDWQGYWSMPEPWVEMILGFRSVEVEAGRLLEKRLKRDKKIWQTNRN
jgi:hypothetical protein